MVQYYTAERSWNPPDSPHISHRAMLSVEGSKVSFHRGPLRDRFQIDKEGNPVCTTDNTYRIYGPLTEEEFEKLANDPFDTWGNLTKGRRPHSVRRIC